MVPTLINDYHGTLTTLEHFEVLQYLPLYYCTMMQWCLPCMYCCGTIPSVMMPTLVLLWYLSSLTIPTSVRPWYASQRYLTIGLIWYSLKYHSTVSMLVLTWYPSKRHGAYPNKWLPWYTLKYYSTYPCVRQCLPWCCCGTILSVMMPTLVLLWYSLKYHSTDDDNL